MREEQDQHRVNAAIALGNSKEPRAVDVLVETLEDKSAKVREVSAIALGRIKNERALEPLGRALQDSDSDVRSAAVRSLERLGGEQAAIFIIGALEDSHQEIRREAIKALERIGTIQAVVPLADLLRSRDASLHREVIQALGTIGDARAVEMLIEMLQDLDDWVRYEAVKSLGKIGDIRAVKPLAQMLLNESLEMRKAVLTSLRQIGNVNEPLPDLISAVVEHKNSERRYAAARALGMVGEEQAVAPLVRALCDTMPVKRAAACSLMRIGSSSTKSLIKEIHNSDDDYVRFLIARILGQIGDKRIVELLIALLGDESADVCSAAIWSLRTIGDVRAIPYLERLAREDTRKTWCGSEVAKMAQQAVQRIASQQDHGLQSQIG